MLPLVIDKQQVFTFKFWFNDQIQTGMQFRNELFCQITSVDSNLRWQAYQRACKLTQQGIHLVITCAPDECSVWASLRDELAKKLLVNPSYSFF